MAVFSRDPREHWLKPHFSKNEVANSGDQACMLVKKRKASITSVADSLGGVSRSQLDRIFLARTGLTVRAWLDRK